MAVLYVASTPIGNLSDISNHSLSVFKEVSLIISEDTRNTKKLLTLLNIDYSEKEFISYYDNIEAQKAPIIAEKIAAHGNGVLVSDAGTPLINDPGYKLIKLINEKYTDEIIIESVPGSSAVINAMVLSGLPPDKFMFLGYMPKKSGQLKAGFLKMEKINEIENTSFIAFESPYRVIKTLEAAHSYFSDKIKIAVCVEMTKKFQRVYIGTPQEVILNIGDKKIKGEVTLVFNMNI